MRYYATLPGKTEPTIVEIELVAEGRYALTIEGKRHEVDARTLPHGAVSLIADGRSYNVELEKVEDEVAVSVRGQILRLDVANERRRRLRAAAAAFSAEGPQVLKAPMPGKVVKVLVAAGDTVQQGQGLIVVEAMKMENELKSPKDGVVSEVAASEGQAVESGAKLLVVE